MSATFECQPCPSFQFLCSAPCFIAFQSHSNNFLLQNANDFGASLWPPYLASTQPEGWHLADHIYPTLYNSVARALPESVAPFTTAPPPEHVTTPPISGPTPRCAVVVVHAPILSFASPTCLHGASAQQASWHGCTDFDAAPPISPILAPMPTNQQLHKAALPV